MTKKQIEQFNFMRSQLIRISKDFMTPEHMRKMIKKDGGYGLDYEETLEMAYENIKTAASMAVKGVRVIKNNL